MYLLPTSVLYIKCIMLLFDPSFLCFHILAEHVQPLQMATAETFKCQQIQQFSIPDILYEIWEGQLHSRFIHNRFFKKMLFHRKDKHSLDRSNSHAVHRINGPLINFVLYSIIVLNETGLIC